MSEVDKPARSFDSRLVMRQSTWCGVVFALAVLLTTLNLFPPSDILYRVRSEVVVSTSRLPQMAAQMKRDRETIVEGDLKYVQLMNMTVLDRSSQTFEGPVSLEQSIALIEMSSLWTGRCTGATHEHWLKAVTRFEESELDSSEVARQNRFAQWEYATAKHYADRHIFLADKAPTATSRDGRTFELATSSTAVPSERKTKKSGTNATLASFTKPSNDSVADSSGDAAAEGGGLELPPQPNAEEVRLKLEAEMEAAAATVAGTEDAWRKTVEDAHGLVEIAAQPKVDVSPRPIGLLVVSSILILGVSAGCIGGWLQHRMHSGQTFDPHTVAEQLALQGLPVAGKVVVTEAEQERDWFDTASQSATSLGRFLTRNLTRISECVIAFWALFLAMRIAFDPMWRSVMAESPLSGLARILAGLP